MVGTSGFGLGFITSGAGLGFSSGTPSGLSTGLSLLDFLVFQCHVIQFSTTTISAFHR